MDLIRGRESLVNIIPGTEVNIQQHQPWRNQQGYAGMGWSLVSGKSWPCHGILYLELDCVAALPSVAGDILDFDVKPRIVDSFLKY